MDQMVRIGLKCIKVDQIEPIWTKIESNRTNVDKIDRIGPKWTEEDQYGPN